MASRLSLSGPLWDTDSRKQSLAPREVMSRRHPTSSTPRPRSDQPGSRRALSSETENFARNSAREIRLMGQTTAYLSHPFDRVVNLDYRTPREGNARFRVARRVPAKKADGEVSRIWWRLMREGPRGRNHQVREERWLTRAWRGNNPNLTRPESPEWSANEITETQPGLAVGASLTEPCEIQECSIGAALRGGGGGAKRTSSWVTSECSAKVDAAIVTVVERVSASARPSIPALKR
jgi:hypothetical protein